MGPQSAPSQARVNTESRTSGSPAQARAGAPLWVLNRAGRSPGGLWVSTTREASSSSPAQ